MGNKTTLYDILEVSAGASEAAIRTAFERLKASYLADQLDSKGMDRNAYFQLVKEAYATLSDASLRRAYDQKLQEPAAPVMALRRSSSTSDRTEGASSGALMWGALLLVLVLAGWGLHSYKTARDAERAMQLEAQRIEAERLAAEAAATERAQALEAERLQREQARDAAALERQRAREFETARRDADRVSQRLESARTQDARMEERSKREQERTQLRDEMQRQREADEARRRLEREKALVRQLEQENRRGTGGIGN